MSEVVFLWSWRNEEHIGRHDVEPEEAQYVIEHARPPFPTPGGDQKLLVWGATRYGRLLQVVFVFVRLEDVQPDELEGLGWHERAALEEAEPAVRIIHARDLTDAEKRRLRRRKR